MLFLDEPTTGLDPRSRSELWEVLRGLVAQGTTLLLTTQYLEEADQLADDIVVIDRGRIIAHGSPLQLKQQAGRASLVVTVADPDDLEPAQRLLQRTGAEVFVDAGRAQDHRAGRRARATWSGWRASCATAASTSTTSACPGPASTTSSST